MSTRSPATITRLVGVYHADGGLIGEARYVIGKLLGTAHCSLCDVTHAGLRRKSDWDAMVADLGVPFDLVHLNEMPPAVGRVVDEHGSPLVLAQAHGGSLHAVLVRAQLEELGGSVLAFADALDRALSRGGWELPGR